MTVTNENVAKCLGLEIAQILLDSSFRDFAIARYESETQRLQESRRYFRSVKAEPWATSVATPTGYMRTSAKTGAQKAEGVEAPPV